MFRKSLQFRCESVCLYFLKQIPAWRGEKVWFGGVFQPVGAWPPGEPCAGGRGGCRRGDLKSAVGAACVGRPKNRVTLAVLTTRRGRDRRGSRAPYGSGECRGDWKSAVGAGWCSLQGQLPQECAGGVTIVGLGYLPEVGRGLCDGAGCLPLRRVCPPHKGVCWWGRGVCPPGGAKLNNGVGG